MSPPRMPRALPALGLAALVLASHVSLFLGCAGGPSAADETLAEPADEREVLAAWDVVYQVLQHPRCLNCHPAGDRPLQGEASLEHAQNVQRGPEGQGLFALRCATCHQEQNAPGAHLPPGAPHWQLPHPSMPLVFEGRSSSELCRQLQDPAHNGQRTPEQILEHAEHDPLVRWGWDPGEGRAPVPVPHEEFAAAMRAWVAGGCACP